MQKCFNNYVCFSSFRSNADILMCFANIYTLFLSLSRSNLSYTYIVFYEVCIYLSKCNKKMKTRNIITVCISKPRQGTIKDFVVHDATPEMIVEKIEALSSNDAEQQPQLQQPSTNPPLPPSIPQSLPAPMSTAPAISPVTEPAAAGTAAATAAATSSSASTPSISPTEAEKKEK